MLLVANLPIQNDANNLKMLETLEHGFLSERTLQELSNEYQHDRVLMVLFLCFGHLIVASA